MLEVMDFRSHGGSKKWSVFLRRMLLEWMMTGGRKFQAPDHLPILGGKNIILVTFWFELSEATSNVMILYDTDIR